MHTSGVGAKQKSFWCTSAICETIMASTRMDFPAHWSEEVATDNSLQDNQKRITNAATNFRWKLVTQTNSRFEFRTRINWKSFGEIVTVDLQPNRIQIQSRCRLVTQCFDWGKNKQNCSKIAQAFTAIY